VAVPLCLTTNIKKLKISVGQDGNNTKYNQTLNIIFGVTLAYTVFFVYGYIILFNGGTNTTNKICSLTIKPIIMVERHYNIVQTYRIRLEVNWASHHLKYQIYLFLILLGISRFH
jgi:hypothetical protein